MEGDKSGAFDRPVRQDVAALSRVWPGRCDYGTWADAFYARYMVHLRTVQGLAVAVIPQLGYS